MAMIWLNSTCYEIRMMAITIGFISAAFLELSLSLTSWFFTLNSAMQSTLPFYSFTASSTLQRFEKFFRDLAVSSIFFTECVMLGNNFLHWSSSKTGFPFFEYGRVIPPLDSAAYIQFSFSNSKFLSFRVCFSKLAMVWNSFVFIQS